MDGAPRGDREVLSANSTFRLPMVGRLTSELEHRKGHLDPGT
jgi:hypothetical protein